MILQEKTLQKDGCEIHYWITPDADGPWLVFLHGAGADHRMFVEQLPAVRDGYRLLLWDARGHGRSRPMGGRFSIPLLVDDMLAILEREGIERATFIGQSMGGNVAQEIVFHHPDKVDALVLIDCPCITRPLTLAEKIVLWATPFFLRLYPWNLLTRSIATSGALKPRVQQYLLNAVRTVGKRDFVRISSATAACLHADPDYRIPVPFLLVCGEQDNKGNIKKIAPAWAKREPLCSFRWIPHAGHCANQDHPEMFNALLVSFLEKTLKERLVEKTE